MDVLAKAVIMVAEYYMAKNGICPSDLVNGNANTKGDKHGEKKKRGHSLIY